MDKDNETELIHKADDLVRMGKTDEVLKCTDYGIKTYPGNAAFYLLKADALYYDLNELDEAIELYEKGLSLLENPCEDWVHADSLVWALNDKADQLVESGKFNDAVRILDKILFYRPDEFRALDKIDSLTKEHGIDYNPSRHYRESLKLKKDSQKRIEKIDSFLDAIVIGEYSKDYAEGCSEFKDYSSFEEYVRDVIICLIESYPPRSEEESRFLAKCNMRYIKSSFENKEPAGYCIIEVGYSCG